MAPESIRVDKNRITQVIQTSLLAREQKTGIFEHIHKAPEEDFINMIKEYATYFNDDKFPLHALFLTTPMVHGDSTEQLFKRISDPQALDKYSWIFDPQKVVTADNNDVVQACTKFFRPGGYNANTFSQWQHNCRIIEQFYNGDLKNYFKKHDNDATKIVDALVVAPRAKTYQKPEFRRFGPKLSRLFIQWVEQYNFYKLKNADSICIPVDFQVCRVMIQTGGVEFDQTASVNDLTVKVLLPTLSEIIKENSFQSRLVSEAIWFVGSNGCNKKRCDLCPIDDYCQFLMPRTSYDSQKVFDLVDIQVRPGRTSTPKPSSN